MVDSHGVMVPTIYADKLAYSYLRRILYEVVLMLCTNTLLVIAKHECIISGVWLHIRLYFPGKVSIYLPLKVVNI